MNSRALLLLAVMALASCASAGGDRGSDVQALLALHEEVLEAHRRSDIQRLLAGASEDFILANRGAISYPTVEDRKARLGPYLESTRFSLYRDQVPPVVKISADGSLGWVIVQVEARGEQTQPDGTIEPLQFVSAWIELYEKRNGRWVSIGNVSNFKPPS